ncbi:MAG: aldehyde dehydrogenase family protein [Pigmentiphaga sp.]|nr:aldehyde dehydrogenase family protein [Pigmentiphaga sp.]
MIHNRDIAGTLLAQRAAFQAEGEVSAERRRHRLHRLARAVLAHEQALTDALQEDYGNRSPFTTRAGDILGTVAAIEYHVAHVAEWMQPERIGLPPEAEAQGTVAELHYQPLGVLGGLIPWNGPILMGCLAAMGGFAAGNRVMLKMSEMAPATGAAFARAIASEFDALELAVFNGDAAVAAEFARQPFDHLIFTGSTATGRKVMRAAAENLVPVTLELGGKSPVVVGASADLALVANRLVAGKLASAGQVCVAPDYVFVPRGQTAALLAECIRAAEALFPDMMRNRDYTCLIHESGHHRMRALLRDALEKGAQASFVPASPALDDLPSSGRFPFVVLTGVSDEMKVMREEIFGPLLPMVEYDTIDTALAAIANGPHPLSAAYFGSNQEEADHVARAIHTGSVVINDVRLQLNYEALPFGGVGPSGMGRYRGHAGFVTFSNRKVILRQGAGESELAPKRPPFGAAAHAALDQALARKKAQFGLAS